MLRSGQSTSQRAGPFDKSAAFQGRNKGLGVKKCSASGVDDQRTVLHLLDAATVQQMMRLRVERCMERHDVTLLEQLVERQVLGTGPWTLVMGQHPAAEASQPVHDRSADASGSDHPDGQVAELFAAYLIQAVVMNLCTPDDGLGMSYRHQHQHERVV